MVVPYRSTLCGKPRLRWLAVCLFLLPAIPAAVKCQTWDVESNRPPIMTGLKSLKPSPEPKPFHVVVFRECESGRRTGKVSFNIVSTSGPASFVSGERNDSVFVRVKLRGKYERTTNVFVPPDSFHLVVLLGLDTAVLKIVCPSSGISIQYSRRSKLLVLDTAREIPDPATFSWIQCTSHNSDRVRQILRNVREAFPQVQACVLVDGYYPCMPASSIAVAGIGRHQTVNETDVGFLVCLRVPAEMKAAFDEWTYATFQKPELDQIAVAPKADLKNGKP